MIFTFEIIIFEPKRVRYAPLFILHYPSFIFHILFL